MNPGALKRQKITDRGGPAANGLRGQGRHIYVASSTKLYCVDTFLLVAGNYAGAGVWTTNPIIATIELGTAGYAPTFIDQSYTVWVFFDNGDIKIIDANPDSGTFNTILSTISLTAPTGVSSLQAVMNAHDRVNNVLVRCVSTSGYGEFLQLTPDGLGVVGVLQGNYNSNINSSGGINTTMMATKYHYPYGIINSSILSACSFIDTRQIKTKVGQWIFPQFLGNGGWGSSWSCDKYAYWQKAGVIAVYDLTTMSLIANISSSYCRQTRAAFSESQKVLITGGWFESGFSFISRDRLVWIGDLEKGFLGTNESGTMEIIASNDVAMAFPRTTTVATTAHVINVANRSYVGYIDFGTNVANRNNTYQVGYCCKNRVEI